ncbi:hypothetical protein [Enhygromyxa salina]|uniref:hypothetical protein n=1 Tax=Enhygromyxa salina TaxID=215803 RepID=UPI0011B1FF82|nr:hypothetical protein [Enhygromyxa salina]
MNRSPARIVCPKMPLLELALLTHSLVAHGQLDLGHLGHALAAPVHTLRAAASTRPGPEPFTYTSEARGGAVQWDPGAPATKATEKLLDLAEAIDDTRTDTTYSHSTRVRRKEGLYHFDCSGMLNWMLARVDKKALETLDRERPVAATYVRTIQKAPTTRARRGWQQVADIEDVEPGDLFSWRRPPNWPKGGNTGHVGIVIARPAPVAHIENAYLVRVIDSTRYKHQDDTRGPDETGFGMGTILFMTDDDRHPIGYAWHGADSSGFYRTDVAFGRIH